MFLTLSVQSHGPLEGREDTSTVQRSTSNTKRSTSQVEYPFIGRQSKAMVEKKPIPVFTTLTDVFGTTEASLPHAERWNNLAVEFERRFRRKPAYIARAPGRVNLIGEHIDYALFGVLPAAIDRDILVACAPRPEAHGDSPGSVVAENLHPKYSRQEFFPTIKQSPLVRGGEGRAEVWFLDIDTTVLRWENYIKAGYYGVLDHYFADGTNLPVPVDLLVTGSVPAGSGLSSSAAMVVASTLAFLAANGKLEENVGALSRGELVELAMLNEKRVGVNSGGMDQAASILSDPSNALYITFHPCLAVSPVKLPPRAVFVVANSLKVADKVLSAKYGYNLRVVETLVAARILARSLGLTVPENEKITIREVVGRYLGEGDGVEIGPDALDNALQLLLQSEKLDVLKPNRAQVEHLGVTMTEMVEMSGLSKATFDEVYLSWVDIEATHFHLYKRAKHVLSEARRVLQFRKTCLRAAAVDPLDLNHATGFLEVLGHLMNESQESCAELFECSCPELDELTRLAREAGALGSRLTGAGWGGCTVSLVLEDKVEDFIQKVRQSYKPYKDLDQEALAEAIFATRPGPGACVFKFD